MAIDSGLKNITKDLCYYSGLFRILLSLSRQTGCPRLLIVTYHRVSPISNNNGGYLCVPVDIFDKHIKFIKDNFKTVSMKDGLDAIYEGRSKDIYAAINFDDGYMDNYLYAYPVLKKYGVPATIFLTTDFIGKTHIFWWDRVFKIVSSLNPGNLNIEELSDFINSSLRDKRAKDLEDLIKRLETRFLPDKKAEPYLMLGWEEAKEMKKNGIDFGSHTKTHRNLCLLEDHEVIEELIGSKREIEQRLGGEASEFSYPFGMFDERVKGLVKEAGFKCARATLRGFNNRKTDRFLLASIGAGSIFKTSFLATRISFNAFKLR